LLSSAIANDDQALVFQFVKQLKYFPLTATWIDPIPLEKIGTNVVNPNRPDDQPPNLGPDTVEAVASPPVNVEGHDLVINLRIRDVGAAHNNRIAADFQVDPRTTLADLVLATIICIVFAAVPRVVDEKFPQSRALPRKEAAPVARCAQHLRRNFLAACPIVPLLQYSSII
jgi:hypothetical protein